jgi:hypothetical protein
MRTKLSTTEKAEQGREQTTILHACAAARTGVEGKFEQGWSRAGPQQAVPDPRKFEKIAGRMLSYRFIASLQGC